MANGQYTEAELMTLAEKYNCGWRMELGLMPVLIFAGTEIDALVEKLERLEDKNG